MMESISENEDQANPDHEVVDHEDYEYNMEEEEEDEDYEDDDDDDDSDYDDEEDTDKKGNNFLHSSGLRLVDYVSLLWDFLSLL